MQAASITSQIGIKSACNLQADDGLRQLRFRLVPKYCSEEQFWNRYFAAVERVKQQVKTEQMWGDFDMLDDDVVEAGGELVSPDRIVTAYLPGCMLMVRFQTMILLWLKHGKLKSGICIALYKPALGYINVQIWEDVSNICQV